MLPTQTIPAATGTGGKTLSRPVADALYHRFATDGEAHPDQRPRDPPIIHAPGFPIKSLQNRQMQANTRRLSI